MAEHPVVQKRTVCPRDCYDGCGVLAEVQDGRVRRVRGDPAHPANRGSLCGKCMHAYNASWLDPALRLTRPLRRTGAKGQGRFEPVSWERALADIAARLQAILQAGPSSRVLHTHYAGTGSLLASIFPERFFHRLGAAEVDPDSVCNKAGEVALEAMFGSACQGFDPRTAEATECLLVWGANPSVSAPHVDRLWLRRRNAPLVVIDPLRHDTARHADLHLQLRPGTDAALAFGLLHLLQREGRLEREFLHSRVTGWERLRPLIEQATPARVAAQTGLAEADMVEAARLYGRGPAMLWLGLGLQRQRLGANAIRAAALLPVARANFGRPGAGFFYLNGAPTRGLDLDWLATPWLAAAEPERVSHMDLAERLADSHATAALFTWNNNIAASSPRQQRLRQALSREDLFHVAVDLFPTDTVNHADYVLPAATFLEFDDLLLPPFHSRVSAQCQVVPPMGESLPNQEIFRRLARAMGFSEPELFEPDQQLLDTLVRRTRVAPDFATLADAGTVDWPERPFVQFPDGVFPTPSGRVEVAGPRFRDSGLPETPLYAVDPPPAEGQLRLLSPASKWLMNSTFGNEALMSRRFESPQVQLHPDEAASRRLQEGQLVQVANEEGALRARLALDPGVPPGVAVMYKGSWPGRVLGGLNVNALFAGQKADAGGSSAVHSVQVHLAPAVPEEPGCAEHPGPR